MWIGRDLTDTNETLLEREESTASSVSLGDTDVWRENGDDNV
jgi:hypothetical protein